MSDSSPPTYSFHGPNTSHSKDNGLVIFPFDRSLEHLSHGAHSTNDNRSGSRTYHVPNYATSYANDRSKLISVKFVEDKELSRAVIVVVSVFLLFAAVPLCMTTLRSSQVAVPNSNPSRSSDLKMHPVVEWPTNEEGVGKDRQQIVHHEEKYSDTISSRHNIPRKHERSADIHWGDPRPGARCLGFGTREYRASLENLPFFANWEAACKERAIEIHGVLVSHPARCERKWPMGGVTGYWIVEEDRCLARWGKITNKGCTKKGSGIRRFSSRLHDIANGEDRMTICSTAPALIGGSEKSRPTFCEHLGFWGVYGVWDVEDQAC